MEFKIENGTDGACMALYDREALPNNFDAGREGNDVPDVYELQDEGRCAVVPTDGDGSHWLNLYVNESAPAINHQYVLEHTEISSLMIPTGKLYYTGCEYMSSKETDFSKKHPHMIETIEIPKGNYSADIYFMQYPDAYLKKILDSKISKKSKLVLSMHQSLGYLALAGLLAAFVAVSKFGIISAIVFLLPLVCWFAMFSSQLYSNADDERDEVLASLPSIVAEFKEDETRH